MDIVLGSTLTWAWPIILAGIALPLISLISGLAKLGSDAKRWLVIGVSLVLGVLYTVAAGLISEIPTAWSEYATRALVITAIVFVVTQAVYGFLKPSLTSLEQKVSRGGEINEQAAQEG